MTVYNDELDLLKEAPEGQLNEQNRKKYDTAYRLFLSEKDEYVPETHIGMYSLFRNPENSAVYMGEEHCQSIRIKTYKACMELFKKYSTQSFCDFFNYNTKALTEIGANYFSTHEKMAAIAELIQAFPNSSIENKTATVSISFGIDKYILKKYIECLRNGDDFWRDPPNCVINRQKQEARKKDFIMFGQDKIKIDYRNSVYMPKNPLYCRFLDWCKIQEIEPYEGILMAIDYLLELHPADELEPVAMYDKISDIDIPIYAKPHNVSKRIERSVVFSGQLFSQAGKIIERYNREPKNAARKLDFDLYCNNALSLLNRSMDIEYSDPDLYEEQVQFEEASQYNKQLLTDSESE